MEALANYLKYKRTFSDEMRKKYKMLRQFLPKDTPITAPQHVGLPDFLGDTNFDVAQYLKSPNYNWNTNTQFPQ